MASASAAQEAVWLRKLLNELQGQDLSHTVILEDNQSAIAMAKAHQFHGRIKHIIKHHFIREQVDNGSV